MILVDEQCLLLLVTDCVTSNTVARLWCNTQKCSQYSTEAHMCRLQLTSPRVICCRTELAKAVILVNRPVYWDPTHKSRLHSWRSSIRLSSLWPQPRLAFVKSCLEQEHDHIHWCGTTKYNYTNSVVHQKCYRCQDARHAMTCLRISNQR